MNIAIAGFGAEGRASYEYWSQDPSNVLTIVDQKVADFPEGVTTIIGEDAFANLNGFDMVVRTPGLAPNKITTDGKIWSVTNEFFAKCPAPIIGVTGSKGKGTTSSFIASMLEAAGRKVWLVGNIGTAALTVLSQIQPDDIVVYELSSFQLWDIEKAPHTAVVLFIEADHLDVHYSMEDYVAAKGNIARLQQGDDMLVYNADNTYASQIAESSIAQKVPYVRDSSAHARDGYFWYGDTRLCSTDAVRIPGAHNIDNAIAAINAIWGYTQDVTAIERGLQNFTGLPHRLSFVRTVNDVSYYDDSIATTPTSAIVALQAFADRPKVIILGGSYKGSDFSGLAQELTRHDVQAVLVGKEGATIAAACDAAGFSQYELLENATAESFTRRAAELAQPGGVVLLSPAAASFDMFKNYADRGDQFIAVVESL